MGKPRARRRCSGLDVVHGVDKQTRRPLVLVEAAVGGRGHAGGLAEAVKPVSVRAVVVSQ